MKQLVQNLLNQKVKKAVFASFSEFKNLNLENVPNSLLERATDFFSSAEFQAALISPDVPLEEFEEMVLESFQKATNELNEVAKVVLKFVIGKGREYREKNNIK